MEEKYNADYTDLWSDVSSTQLLQDTQDIEQFADPSDDEVLTQVL